nr:MAG TPA: hypothetical protein [Crassvirales sp.]
MNKYMKRVIEEVIKNVNIVKCEGAICVSVNNNFNEQIYEKSY